MNKPIRTRTLIPALLLLLTASCSVADQDDRIVELVKEQLPDGGAGLAIGVYRHGEPLFERAFGQSDLEHGTANTVHTRFHIASVSKHFTAFAILLLEQDGKLSLDDDIRDYLPRVPDFGDTITIRDLIHHTSGLRDQWLLLRMSGQTFEDHLTQEEVLNLVSRQEELNFRPGTQYTYSNTGYTLLGEIVAKVSGQGLDDFMQARVFGPLAMRDSHFYDDVSESLPGRAHSYEWREGEQRWGRVLLNYETVGATSLFTSLADMARWVRNFQLQEVGGDGPVDTLLSTAPGRLEDGRDLNYRYGFMVESLRGYPLLLHGGSDAAFRALIAYLPEQEFAVVVLANTPFDRRSLLDRIVGMYLGDAPGGAGEGVPGEVAPPDGWAAGIAGQYLPDNGSMISFVERDGALLQLDAGGTSQPVIYRADGSFDTGFPTRHWSYYRAGDSKGGQVESIVELRPADPSSRTNTYRRIPPSSNGAVSDDYAGWYYSAEFDTSYRLSIVDGNLFASALRWQAPVALRQVQADRFDSSERLLGSLEFERDSAGAVTGFRSLLGRFNRILFRKVGASPVSEIALTPAPVE